MEADLIDEMIIHVMPVVLGEGRPLFGGIPMEKVFRLTDTASHPNGVLKLHYTV
ncbi:dihydrofolate reductase family protein [Chitinophaga ginsengisegetis]|uniref:dihydrofolate reductase family protein n=1 Tax=Chitinophaga ginsengisegetis TaxID=393003 RepID=UPI0009A6838A|nr:dihydrofolate reductase family protein [Chitinophaga ginsengisegetis]